MLRCVFLGLILLLSPAFMPAAPLPAELDRALKLYRAEGAAGWGYTQTTESSKGQSLVEHYDPAKPPFSRWTLVLNNGSTPGEADLKDYRDRLSRRTSGTAPNIKDQIDRDSCELLREDSDRASYRFKLATTDKADRSAAHMHAVFTLHKASGAIEQVSLTAFEPFSPMFAVKVTEAETTIIYSIPEAGRPSLLQKISVRMRGRVMWLKSLDDDMTVTYSGHFQATGKTPSSP